MLDIFLVGAVFGSFILALILALGVIPTIITVVKEKNLYDEPGERASHIFKTPTLGGFGLFLSVMVSYPLFSGNSFGELGQYFVAASVIIFAVGIKDDILAISPMKKMLGQIVSALILSVLADVRLSHLQGFFDIHELSYTVSIILSVLLYIVVINAYNFIDGIDGLAAAIGTLNCFVFGIWFVLRGEQSLAVLAFSLAGSLIGFFYYNAYSKKFKIFMGDTGSLFVGLALTVFGIKFNELNIDPMQTYGVNSALSVSFAIMVIPLFDFIRVIYVRSVLQKSITSADNLHLHHRVLRLGLSHRRATYWMVTFNTLFAMFGFYFQFISIRRLFLLELLIAMLFSYLPVLIYDIRKKRKLLHYNENK